MMINRITKLYLFAVAILLLVSACATEQMSSGQKPLNAKKTKAEDKDEKIKKLFEQIYERNRTLKKSPEWLKAAYSGLKIRRLNDIPKEQYQDYKRFLSGKNIYFVIHPGYYAFSDPNKSTFLPKENIQGFPSKNVVERFVDTLPQYDLITKVVKEQEILLRDFLEFMSTEKRLVVLVVPRNYKANVNYGETTGLDEYARYINELTNMSDSIIYMESQGPDDGLIEDRDLEILTAFLNEIGAKKILLGGGYLGKCVDNFYESIRRKFKYEDVYFVPELLTISPHDMITEDSNLLTKSGKINFGVVSKFLNANGITTDSPGEVPQFKNLSLYKVYR